MKLFEMMYMNTAMNYESIFGRYGGIMCTCEITGKGISVSDASKSNKTRKSTLF